MNPTRLQHIQTSNFEYIVEIIPEGCKVLDLGCGSGDLLDLLIKNKKVKGYGIEIDLNNVIDCLAKGIPVVHGDIDLGLTGYADNSYDYVILSRTLQVVKKPLFVIQEMLRVGKYGIVLSPNFGNARIRFRLLFTGRMPKSKTLPFEWYDTPNIHLFTIKDFRNLCKTNNITIEKEIWISDSKARKSVLYKPFSNFLAKQGLFIITKQAK